MYTPWGPSDSVESIAPGILRVGTAGHGGYRVSDRLLATMHPALQRQGGSYEEDCEWSLVVLAFPMSFSPDEHERALRVAAQWEPDALMNAGITAPKSPHCLDISDG
jgi:uncharacterized protein DUF7007